MKKVEVDKSVCIGCGACTGVADGVFTIGSDGLSEVKKDIVSEEVASEAVDCCPTGAISAKDVSEEEQLAA